MRDKGHVSDENDHRLLRYQMQSIVIHILPDNRVGICLRCQVQKNGTVDVLKHREAQKAFYGGLMICGSIWVCPVCASKISERRRAELKRASTRHRELGGHLSMLTLTFSHSKSDALADLLKALGQATAKFRRGKRHDNIRGKLAIEGIVRALEIMYGDINGWHPHIHLLIFHQNEIEDWEREEYEDEFYKLWSTACEKYGLSCSREHGVKLEDATAADQYIGKWGDLVEKRWGVDSEMTKSHIKKGRKNGLTPFDFIRRSAEDGDLEYAPQFKEYAKAMKGKTQLKWSRGLKEKFLIKERTDEEVAAAKEEPADVLGGLSCQDWSYIIKNDYRARLLDYVEKYGYEEALEKIGLNENIITKRKEKAQSINNWTNK